jgi:hypothetical protein
MHPIICGFISCLWAFVVAPALCPSMIEVLLVFIFVVNSSWSFASMLLMLVIVEFIAFVWSTICLIAFEYLSARIVIHGAHYEMFSSKWWAFHWCDMFRSRYHLLWPHFFADSPIFTWFMRSLLGARVGKNVVISEPHLNEPQLQVPKMTTESKYSFPLLNTRLQSIGNDSVISWNSWLQPHTYNGHTLILGSINVGNSCFVDSHAVSWIMAFVLRFFTSKLCRCCCQSRRWMRVAACCRCVCCSIAAHRLYLLRSLLAVRSRLRSGLFAHEGRSCSGTDALRRGSCSG